MIPRFKPSLNWRELGFPVSVKPWRSERFEKAFAEKFQAVEAVAFPMAVLPNGLFLYGRSQRLGNHNAVLHLLRRRACRNFKWEHASFH